MASKADKLLKYVKTWHPAASWLDAKWREEEMITLAEHKDGQLTGRVAYLECSRDDLTDLLPLLGGPAPQDISKGVVTPTVFAYNAKVHGQEVSVDALFKVEVAPGIWAPYGSPAATLDKLGYKD